jgi:Protein of unknown function (DUF4239)
MLDFLYDLPMLAQGLLIVGATLALSLAGLALTRRFVDAETCRAHHDVAGFIYATVGVLYAVLLAFAAVIVWQDSDKAAEILHREATAIADLNHGVGLLPVEFAGAVRGQIKAYVTALVEDEWPQMRRGQRSAKASEALRTLFASFGRFEPGTKQQETIYVAAFEELRRISEGRRLRLFAAEHGLHPVVWWVLILGAAITIAYTYLFAPRSVILHAVMTSALGASIGIIFFLIFALDYPFQDPGAAGRLRALLEGW